MTRKAKIILAVFVIAIATGICGLILKLSSGNSRSASGHRSTARNRTSVIPNPARPSVTIPTSQPSLRFPRQKARTTAPATTPRVGKAFGRYVEFALSNFTTYSGENNPLDPQVAFNFDPIAKILTQELSEKDVKEDIAGKDLGGVPRSWAESEIKKTQEDPLLCNWDTTPGPPLFKKAIVGNGSSKYPSFRALVEGDGDITKAKLFVYLVVYSDHLFLEFGATHVWGADDIAKFKHLQKDKSVEYPSPAEIPNCFVNKRVVLGFKGRSELKKMAERVAMDGNEGEGSFKVEDVAQLAREYLQLLSFGFGEVTEGVVFLREFLTLFRLFKNARDTWKESDLHERSEYFKDEEFVLVPQQWLVGDSYDLDPEFSSQLLG